MKQDLNEKLKFLTELEYPVLSVYLSFEGKSTPFASELKTLFNSLIHQNLKEADRDQFRPDIEKIENYLVEKFSRENTRTLVFFSSGDKLWEALDFEFYVPSQIKITSGAFTKPLEDVLKNYHRYLVIAADHKKATVFTVNLGEIEEKIEIVDDQVPQRVKVKKVDYNKDNIIFRHIEDHLHRHLKLIAEKAGHFASGKEIDFIIVAGHKELLNKIKQHLLYPLDKKPVSELVTDVNIPLNEILIKSKEVAVEFNQGGR